MKYVYNFLIFLTFWVLGCYISSIFNDGDPRPWTMAWGALVVMVGQSIADLITFKRIR